MERGLELDGGDSAVSSWWGWREAKEMEFGGLWERKGSGVLGFGEKPQEWHLRGEEKAIWRVAREDGGRAWKTVRSKNSDFVCSGVCWGRETSCLDNRIRLLSAEIVA